MIVRSEQGDHQFGKRNGVIPIKSKVIHKFYEPAVLLKALNVATRASASQTTTDVSIHTQDDKQIFQAFVYKLGHICDNVKGNGGRTITSFTVLRDGGDAAKAHYWFASNQRTHEELETTADYIREILRLASRAPSEGAMLKSAAKKLLVPILEFNRVRVNTSLLRIITEAKTCLKHSLNEADEVMCCGLHRLIGHVKPATTQTMLSNTFVSCCRDVIYKLDIFQKSSIGREIAERARAGRQTYGIPSKECWSELQHVISRTLAYEESVKFILLAKSKWPELFEDFKISFLESSTPMSKPYRKASQTADAIVGRMTRKPKEIQIFRNFVEELQAFNLDELIQREYQNEDFRPIVHSEILLLDHLEKTGQLQAEDFFGGWKFIGSSKPTCKLCSHYFEAHKSGVEHRPTHGNLYISWRVPDVLRQGNGEGDEDNKDDQARQVMIDRMLERIRKDAFDIVRKRSPSTYKANDSDTFSARLSTRRWDQSVADVDDMASTLGQMDLNDR